VHFLAFAVCPWRTANRLFPVVMVQVYIYLTKRIRSHG
jgi:hypothetical protein